MRANRELACNYNGWLVGFVQRLLESLQLPVCSHRVEYINIDCSFVGGMFYLLEYSLGDGGGRLEWSGFGHSNGLDDLMKLHSRHLHHAQLYHFSARSKTLLKLVVSGRQCFFSSSSLPLSFFLRKFNKTHKNRNNHGPSKQVVVDGKCKLDPEWSLSLLGCDKLLAIDSLGPLHWTMDTIMNAPGQYVHESIRRMDQQHSSRARSWSSLIRI